MTIKDLYGYIDAKREAELFKAALRDHYSRITSVGGQDFGAVEISKFHTDRQADSLAITVKLEELIKNAERKMVDALDTLYYAQTVLRGKEIIYFQKRFIEGKSRREIMREMHYGHSTIDRFSQKIAEKIREL